MRSEVADWVGRACPRAAIERLPGDASTRTFHRIRPPEGPSRILMDYGAPFSGETDDVRLTHIFAAAGLRVAEILDVGEQVGCLLLEDLGDRSLETALGEIGSGTPGARDLLERAVLLAAEVAARGSPVLALSDRCDGPALDAERFRFEMDFYLEHYVTGLVGVAAPPRLRQELHELADRSSRTPRPVLCHRDFHCRNLMVLSDGNLAMVDIQDARWGPDTYDLASLLRDAYIDIDEAWVEPLLARYETRLSWQPGAEDFRERFDVVSIQRMIKALGTFGYQRTVRGITRYSGAVVRTLGRLTRLLPETPSVGELGRLLEASGLLFPPASR